MGHKPWELHPALNRERLEFIAKIISKERHGIINANEINVGKCNWGLGCYMYDACRRAITEASQNSSWLGISDHSLHFVFSIGGVPIRFYRGEPDTPTNNSLKVRIPEQQEAFFFMDKGVNWFWRLAIETEQRGDVIRAVLLQATQSGDTRNHFEIPIVSKMDNDIADLAILKREGVKLDAPPIVLKRQKEHTAGFITKSSDAE